MEKPKSYKEYSSAFLHMFVFAFASANKHKVIPSPIMVFDVNSLQYRHLHRNYSKIVRYLDSVHDNGRNYSLYEKKLYQEFHQINRRSRATLGRQARLSTNSLEEITTQ